MLVSYNINARSLSMIAVINKLKSWWEIRISNAYEVYRETCIPKDTVVSYVCGKHESLGKHITVTMARGLTIITFSLLA